MTPLVALGIPVYNGAKHLRRALDSILAQTHDNLVVYIMNNASSDETGEIGWEYTHKDDRVRYYRHLFNIGAVPNFMEVFKWSQPPRRPTPYFKWAAHDDELDPTYIEECLDVLQTCPQAVVCHSKTRFINALSEPLWVHGQNGHFDDDRPATRYAGVLRYVDIGNALYGVIRTEALQSTRGLRAHPSSDLVLLAELALRGDILEVPIPLFRRRLHDGQSRRQRHTPIDLWHGGPGSTREHWRVLQGFLGALRGSYGSVEGLLAVARWMYRYRTSLWKELRRA